MTTPNEAAQVDKDALKAEAQLRASYQTKVCPIMSIGGDKFKGGLLTGLGERPQGQQEAEVVACLGTSCQFFCFTSADDAGRPTGGGCALALVPSGLIQLQHTLAAVAERLIPKSDTNKS